MYEHLKNQGRRTTFTGMAGNLRVASELLLRDMSVSFPLVDDGVDLEVCSLVKVQVKSAHVMSRRTSEWNCQPSYNFILARGPKALGGGRATRQTPRVFSEKCDFVVLWGIEQSRFWIVPAALLDNRHTVCLGPDIRWISTDNEKIMSLYQSGMKYEDIGKELGISTMTVCRRVNGIMDEPGPVVAAMKKIKECEGRWNLIQDYIDVLRQANQATSLAVLHER